MSYIAFDHNKLVNLRYSLSKEVLRSNRFGGYAGTTLAQCNTRKYHGLLVIPQPQIDSDKHVLLSNVQEMIKTRRGDFNLGIYKYPGRYYPKGHKYLSSFDAEPIPKWRYRAGDIIFNKSLLLKTQDHKVFIRYEVEKAPEKFKLRLRTFLAFRNYHNLSKANVYINTHYQPVANGALFNPYPQYTPLYIQLSRKNEYVHAPDWYYNIEYDIERERGYPYQEDLWVPGYFEVELKQGDVLFFAAGTSPTAAANMKSAFENELKSRIPRSDFKNCLLNAAGQFIEKRENGTVVCAGLHWFGSWGRDTFIALPGLTLPMKKYDVFHEVLATSLRDLKNGLFPNVGTGAHAAYNSADASMWFVWSVQQLLLHEKKQKKIRKRYSQALKSVFYAYRNGSNPGIFMDEDGLIHAEAEGKALTWMDAVTSDGPVTQRAGKTVEINALWYNAVCFMLDEIADGDDDWKNDLLDVKNRVEQSFIPKFWLSGKHRLADVVHRDFRDISMRPNQVFACSMPYSLLDNEQKAMILRKVKKELLTPRGLRSLAPKNPMYKGIYSGNQEERDLAYHQGTVWMWLAGHFAQAWLDVFGPSRRSVIENWLKDVEPHLFEAGISTLSEIFDGDPPHRPKGAISQAWSVAEVLRIMIMLNQMRSTI